ncbi:MAG: helix-turn-helix transcriptional regulator [Spirochaetales bacterium]|nr:helix-turn-helix transcriptional regulator [Spirochaetales bacterium]
MFPGVDNFSANLIQVFRSVGTEETGSQIGYGFMRKPGIVVDEENSVFPYYSCSYIIRGEGTYIDEQGKKYTLSAGYLFQRFPGKRHSTIINPHSDWAECFVDFGKNIYADFLLRMNFIDPETPVLRSRESSDIEQKIWNMMNKLESSDEGDLPDLTIESLSLLRKLINSSREFSGGKGLTSQIEQSCRDFSENHNFRQDLHKYCKERGIGYESFRKQFKKITGLSPLKYIIRSRIDNASYLLLMTSKSIGEIAEELGYKSQYEFSAQFKEIIGSSPRNYRKKKG